MTNKFYFDISANKNNIQEFISMDAAAGQGKVLNFWEFCEFFTVTR